MLTLIIARCAQGLGGGGILPLAQTIIADLLSPRERPRYQSYSAIAFVSASILGPVIGGFLTDQLHWSLIFWINVPLGAAALLMTDRALRRLPRNERPHRLDVVGAVLMVGAAVALMLALNWGGTRYAWSSTPILALIAASALLWVSFALRLTVAPEPFIPTTMLRDPVVGAITAAGFFSIGTIVGLSIYFPLYFQLVLGLSASASGLALISFMAGSVIGSIIAGRLVAELTRYKRVPMAGLGLAIAMLAAFAARPGELSVAEVSALLAVGGLGLGTMYPVTTMLMQNAVPLHQVGTATGALNFFRLLGGAIIVAAFGAIILGAFGASDTSITHDTLIEAGRLSRGDFAARFRWVFVAAAVCLSAAFLAVMLVREQPLRGPPLPRVASE
jgi:MFS family permease